MATEGARSGKIGTGIRKGVADQIRTRQVSLGKTFTKTREDILYQNARTAWIRLCSSVNTLSQEEIKKLEEKNGRTDIKGANYLARTNILQGGLLNPNRALRGGINTSPTVDNNAAYNNRPNSTGIRPMPGITGMTVKSKNTYGTLREAEVKISVWTLEDFDMIEKLYLRPGFSMLLEWGHTMYFKNYAEKFETEVHTVSPNLFFGNNVKVDMILNDIDRVRQLTDYNYDGMFGYVKNFSWNFKPTGEYECTVNIISTGEIIESIKATFDPRLRIPNENEFDDKDSEQGKEQRKSVFHYAVAKLSKMGPIFGSTFTNEDLADEAPTLAAKLEPFTGYYDDIQLDDGWFLDTETPMQWIPLRTFLDIMNKLVAPVDNTKSEQDTGSRTYFKFNTDLNLSSDLLTFPTHFSIDPTVCVLPFIPDISDWSYRTFFFSVVPGKVDAIHNNLAPELAEFPTNVLNILVSVPYLKQKLDEALDTEGKFNKSISDIITSIFEGMNDALGGINELSLVYDEEYDGGTFFVVDRKNTTASGDQSEVINISGLGTTVSEVSISSKITNEMSSQISVAAQGTTQNYSENVDNILKWNSGIIDRIRVTKDVSSKSKETAQEEEDDKSERMGDWMVDVIDFFQNFNSNTGYTKEELEAAKTCHKEWTVDQANKHRVVQSQPVPGLVPVELSLTLDGIGGLRVAESFKINAGILPSKYNDKFGYIITGLEHTIDKNNRWTTAVTTQFFIIETPSAEQIAAAKTLGKPTTVQGSNQTEQSPSTTKEGAVSKGPTPVPPPELVKAMRRYGITSPKERAHFLAQCAHESGGFRWKKEFASGKAYEGRKDLGNTQPGDGVKFKGRGYIQITGRDNYTRYNNYLKTIGSKADVLNNPAQLETDYFAADSACYWWKYLSRNISGLAVGTTTADVQRVTKRVNGGTNGLADRQAKFNKYWGDIEKDNSAYA